MEKNTEKKKTIKLPPDMPALTEEEEKELIKKGIIIIGEPPKPNKEEG